MDEREQQRRIRHRLSVLRHAEEISGNVAATYRYYGISRPTFYKWLRQFEEFGEEGLHDRSSRPRFCPHQTDAEIVSKIVYLRQHYHFGPAKISMYLARYHEVTVSRSGVWRIAYVSRTRKCHPPTGANVSTMNRVSTALPRQRVSKSVSKRHTFGHPRSP